MVCRQVQEALAKVKAWAYNTVCSSQVEAGLSAPNLEGTSVMTGVYRGASACQSRSNTARSPQQQRICNFVYTMCVSVGQHASGPHQDTLS